MSLWANPVDEADILATIRLKLADSKIQRSYWLDSQVFRRRGDGSLCRGCDRPILKTDRTSLGYMSAEGERHWFHLLCDTVRQFVAVNELKQAPRGTRRRQDNDAEGLLVVVPPSQRGPGTRLPDSRNANTEQHDSGSPTSSRRRGAA